MGVNQIRKTLRSSEYNLYIPLKNNTLLIQGVYGSFDVVENRLAQLVQESNLEEISRLYGKEIPGRLIKRGYITEKTQEEELAFLDELCEKLLEKSQQNINISFVVTYNCNFRCEYCCERFVQNKGDSVLRRTITAEMVDAVFSQIKEFIAAGKKVDSVTLFGGEPLLPQNESIIRYICQKARMLGISIFCISNGFFLKQYVSLFKEYGVEKVQITLDGDRSEHNKRRFLASGHGTYDTIIENITYALNEGICISLRANINKKNINQIKRLIDLYTEYKWTESEYFTYYFKATMPCYEELKDICSDVEVLKEIEDVFGIENMDKFRFNSVYSSLSYSLKSMLENKGFAPLKSVYCGAVGGLYNIDASGDIYACNDTLTDSECVIGKVDTEKGKFVFNENHDIWKGRAVTSMSHCKMCPYLLFCGGGCAGQARLSSKDGIYNSYCMDFQRIFRQVAAEVCEAYLSKTPSNH